MKCNIESTYCKSYAPDIDRITPLNAQQCLRSPILNGHDITGVWTGAESRLSKVGEQKWPGFWLQEAGEVYGPIFELLARNGIFEFIVFQFLQKRIVV